MRSEKRPPPKAFSGDGHFRTNGTPPPGAPLDGKPPTDAIKDFVLELKALRRYGLDLVAARVGRTRAKLKAKAPPKAKPAPPPKPELQLSDEQQQELDAAAEQEAADLIKRLTGKSDTEHRG